MELKKTHNGANAFCSAYKLHLIKNMRESLKKCMSDKNLLLKVIISCVILLLNTSFAYADVEVQGMRIYYKVVLVGKFVILVKGGIEIINSCANGDFQNAKKCLIGYLMAYGALYLLPYAMDEVENVFKGM